MLVADAGRGVAYRRTCVLLARQLLLQVNQGLLRDDN
jgi:hypothetical protein